MSSIRPLSAHVGGRGGGQQPSSLSAHDYESAKRRVKRLETPSPTTSSSQNSAHRGDVGGGRESAGTQCRKGGNSGIGFVEKLQNNISELRDGMLLKLEQNPQLKIAIDSDIKEMQLHIDRIVMHQISEKDATARMASELKRGFETELETAKTEFEAQLEVMRSREGMAEERAAAILADCVAEMGRREREVEAQWRGRVEALTVQLNNDMVVRTDQMAREVRDRYEREKREAMAQLSEELIPKIQAEVTETHTVEIERYQRRLEEERKRGEAKAKTLQERLEKTEADLEDTIQGMVQISAANVQDKAAKEKLHEVIGECLRLRQEITSRDDIIGELEGSITHLEEGVLSAEDEILRLQGAVSDLAADRDAADERARLNEEAAAREIEDLREAQTEMHERHVKELKDIRARVRRAVEAKEKERADLAERLHAAEQKMAETDAVLQRAKLDIGTL